MKIRNPFTLPMFLLLIVMILASCSKTFASSPSNYELAKSYAKHHYPKCKVVLLKKYDEKKIEHRKGKNIVYIEKFISYSKGKYGYSKKGEYVKYNKKVKKGKKVVSYFVYNPYTNYFDDVVAVVDNKMIR